jgi:hypothetical protein
MDTVSHHYVVSVFKDWKYAYSDWTRKYIDGDPKKGMKKIFWIINYPAFWWDLWHLAKQIMVICLGVGAVFYSPIVSFWLDLLILPSVFSISFIIGYEFIFRIDRKERLRLMFKGFFFWKKS